MASRLITVGLLATIVAAVATASAVSTSYSTSEEAARAGLNEILGDGWTILGSCDQFPTEKGSWDICLKGTRDGDSSFNIYATVLGVPDFGWWVGVKLEEDGWIPYDGGRCNMVYCRRTMPNDTVIDGWGWPNGDANGDGMVDSLDALRVLELVAQAADDSEQPFSLNGNVDGSGLDSRDALLILQSHAGLIGGLPVRKPSSFDFTDK